MTPLQIAVAALERLRSEYGGTNVQAIVDTALAAVRAAPVETLAGDAELLLFLRGEFATSLYAPGMNVILDRIDAYRAGKRR